MELNYGGPGELVTPDTGFALSLGSRIQIIERIRGAIHDLASDPQRVLSMGIAARKRVSTHFTWDVKARKVIDVYEWVSGKGAMPS